MEILMLHYMFSTRKTQGRATQILQSVVTILSRERFRVQCYGYISVWSLESNSRAAYPSHFVPFVFFLLFTHVFELLVRMLCDMLFVLCRQTMFAFLLIKEGFEANQQLVAEIKTHVRNQIGKFASVEHVRFRIL